MKALELRLAYAEASIALAHIRAAEDLLECIPGANEDLLGYVATAVGAVQEAATEVNLQILTEDKCSQ